MSETKPYTLRLPVEMIEALEQVSRQEEVSVSAVMRKAIRRYLLSEHGVTIDAYMQHGGKRDQEED